MQNKGDQARITENRIRCVHFTLENPSRESNSSFQASRSKNKTLIPTKIHMLSSEFCNSDDFLELNLWTFDMDLRTNHDTSVIHLKR